MPRITKGNAREHLSEAITRFQKVTGESIGVVYSWKGALSVIGNNYFREHISDTKETVWRSLTFERSTLDDSSNILDKEDEMVHLIQQDLKSLSVQTLRKILSWATQKATGKPRNFWGNNEFRPIFWPKDVPFLKKSKNLDRTSLLIVVQSIREFLYPEPSESIRDRSPIHLKTNKDPLETEIDDTFFTSPTATPSVISSQQQSQNNSPGPYSLDLLSNSIPSTPIVLSGLQPDHSHSPALLRPFPDTSPASIIKLSGAIPLSPLNVKFITILNEKVRKECLRELSNPNTFLSDVTINAFGVLMKNNYPHILGLQDTLLSENRQFIKAPLTSFQIHHDGGLHWVCSRIDGEGNVSVYDSMFHQRTSEQLDIQLALLYCRESGDLKVTVEPLQQQRGVSDCGVFAITVCIALANGLEPDQMIWRQANMRNHLQSLINSEKISPLPTLSNRLASNVRSSTKLVYTIKLWCLCRLPEFAYKNMVMCPSCNTWFHKPCIGLKDTSQKVLSFKCRKCQITKMKE